VPVHLVPVHLAPIHHVPIRLMLPEGAGVQRRCRGRPAARQRAFSGEAEGAALSSGPSCRGTAELPAEKQRRRRRRWWCRQGRLWQAEFRGVGKSSALCELGDGAGQDGAGFSGVGER
jgi:hypothetical protein